MTCLLRSWLTLIVCSLLCACTPEWVTATQVSVTVHSELGPDLTSLEVQLYDAQESEPNDGDTYTAPVLKFPFTFAIVPAPGGLHSKVLVVARGKDAAGLILAEAKIVVAFVEHENRGVDMLLSDDCRGMICGPTKTCSKSTNFTCSDTMTAVTRPIAPDGDAGASVTIPPVASPDAGIDMMSGPSNQTPGSVQPMDAAVDAVADSGSPSLVDAGARDSGSPSPDAGSDAGPAGPTCCSGCSCRGSVPASLASAVGEYTTAELAVAAGTIFYPTNAAPPFAGISTTGGMGDSGSQTRAWGPWLASHGMVVLVSSTILAGAQPAVRAEGLLAAIGALQAENTRAGSPLQNKMSGRYGVLGFSMGGGGATIAASMDSSLKCAIGLGSWSPVGAGIAVPTMLVCGTSDELAACGAHTDSAYSAMPAATQKLKLTISLATHAYVPTGYMGTPGQYVLAFTKVFLEGDARWKSLLLMPPGNAAIETNIR